MPRRTVIQAGHRSSIHPVYLSELPINPHSTLDLMSSLLPLVRVTKRLHPLDSRCQFPSGVNHPVSDLKAVIDPHSLGSNLNHLPSVRVQHWLLQVLSDHSARAGVALLPVLLPFKRPLGLAAIDHEAVLWKEQRLVQETNIGSRSVASLHSRETCRERLHGRLLFLHREER